MSCLVVAEPTPPLPTASQVLSLIPTLSVNLSVSLSLSLRLSLRLRLSLSLSLSLSLRLRLRLSASLHLPLMSSYTLPSLSLGSARRHTRCSTALCRMMPTS